jgi:hypothetical protein
MNATTEPLPLAAEAKMNDLSIDRAFNKSSARRFQPEMDNRLPNSIKRDFVLINQPIAADSRPREAHPQTLSNENNQVSASEGLSLNCTIHSRVASK